MLVGDIEASRDRPDGALLVRHPVPLAVGADVDGQRLNAALDRRPAVLRGQVLPGAGTGTIYVDAKLSVIRQRAVGGGFHEQLRILNHANEPVTLEVRIDADSDFADLFEVKDALEKKGSVYRQADEDVLVLGYRRGTYVRETRISPASRRRSTTGPHVRGPHRAARRVDHRPRRHAGARAAREPQEPPKYGPGRRRPRPDMADDLEAWLAAAPTLGVTGTRSGPRTTAASWTSRHCGSRPHPAGTRAARRRPAVVHDDVRARQHLHEPAGPALHPELARRRFSRSRSGRARGGRLPRRGPGKILHEMRFGELTAFEERPHSPYYGSADATPLFVVLLDEYERWTGDTQLVRDLEYEARAALRVDRRVRRPPGQRLRLLPAPQRGDRAREPVLEGLWDSISYHDGRLPGFPRATCELQGYAYDAKVRGARLARDGLGRRRPTRTGSRRRPPASRHASTATSGSRTASTTPSRSTPTARRSTPSRRTSATCCGAASSTRAAKAVVAHHMSPRHVQRLGRADARRGAGPLQPDRLPQRHGLAVRQLVHRLGPAPLRLQGGGGAHRLRHPRCRRVLRRPAARGVRRLPASADQATRSSSPPPAARRRGPPAPRCCCCARCSAWSRRASTSSSTRRYPRSIGRLEVLDIPGRWGQDGRLRRGRVET
jgi:hypothetical protein